jgi:hypothetical protein
MADNRELQRADVVFLGIELDDHLASKAGEMPSAPVHRSAGTPFSLDAVNDLLQTFRSKLSEGMWTDNRSASDAWLAPRFHAALRLDRATASDKNVWHWMAVELAPDYVEWRWRGDKGISNDRWFGPVHKQALARLWWGAEIFRDGADYSPVSRAFKRQDLINSYLHRPLVRCRSFALGIVDVLTDKDGEALPASQVNDLARVLNLCTAGSPPEPHVQYQQDDHEAVREWARSDAEVPESWDPLPLGPMAYDTTESSLTGGRALADHGMYLAGLAQLDSEAR